MERAVTSASNIFRRALCPGSERLETGLPDEDSDQSLEGTLLHKHAADPTLDRKKLKASQRDLLEINDRLIREVFERVAAQFGDEMAISTGKENVTWHLHRGIKSLFPGHPDLWEYRMSPYRSQSERSSRLLIVLDYKFGFKIVTPASANIQLRTYAVMGTEVHDVDTVVVAITQPRLSADDRLTMAVYSRADIEASRQQLYQIWDAAKAPDAPLVPGEEQCRYCKARTICPAFRETIVSSVAIVPSVTGLTPAARESKIEERIKQASDAELAKLYDAVHLAGFVKDPLFDEIRDRIRAGGMEGYRLGKSKDVREITDVAKAIDLLVAEGLPRDKIMETCSMSIGDDGGISEIYRNIKGGTWKATRDNIDKLLAAVIEHKTWKPSIEKVKALPA